MCTPNRAATADALAAEGMSEEEVSKAVEDELAREREDEEVTECACIVVPSVCRLFLDYGDRSAVTVCCMIALSC